MIDQILNKCLNEDKLSTFEIQTLLTEKKAENIEKIYEAARTMRSKYFGNKVFLYGFVYFSTYCKNECAFCYYRNSNGEAPRYRKSLDEIVATAVELKESGINLIDLTMGEDPYFLDNPEKLVEIVKAVKAATDLPVMVSPGLVDNDVIDKLAAAGADWYALYQETHNQEIFATSRIFQDYQARIDAKIYAKSKGMLTEEGLLTGIGDNAADAAHSFVEMERMGVSQVRVMTFVPQSGTPFADIKPQGFQNELLYIAVMRLLFPQKLIPASLDVDGLRGLKDRLDAGANVVTSIIPPCEGYMGVANSEFDVDDGYRTIAGIAETLKNCGVEGATADEYKSALDLLKTTIAELMAS